MDYLPTVAPTAPAKTTAKTTAPLPLAQLVAGLTPSQQRSYQLLTDPEIGIMPANALKVAQWHDLLTVFQHTWSWWLEEKSPGALFFRLSPKMIGNFAPRREPPPAFLQSDFYRRHYPTSPATAARLLYDLYGDETTGDPAIDAVVKALPQPDWANKENDDYP